MIPAATPNVGVGGSDKYAHIEREVRHVLAEVPRRAQPPGFLITDHYLDGARLRVRRVENPDGTVMLKLGQKIRVDLADPAIVRHTTVYLDAAEYTLLVALPAAVLVKRRLPVIADGRRWVVDVFEGALTGLILAEREVHATDLPAGPPHEAIADVSHDNRFAGGALARLDAAGAADLLASLDSLSPVRRVLPESR